MPTSGWSYRWRQGKIEITRVLEFEAALFEPATIHPDLTPTPTAGWIRSHERSFRFHFDRLR